MTTEYSAVIEQWTSRFNPLDTKKTLVSILFFYILPRPFLGDMNNEFQSG
jgi:hypothetical protein